MPELEKNILIQAFDQLPLGTLIVDARATGWPIVYVNPVIGQLTGFEIESLLGSPWHELLCDPAELATQCERLAGNHALVVRRLKQRWQSRAGVPLDMELQVSPLYDRPGEPAYWLVTADAAAASGEDSDRSALHAALRDAQMRLRQVDRIDPVTGLLNRPAFEETLARDWVTARREQRRVTLVVLRVDAFDRYRELYGRHAADSCLRKLAHAISGSLRRAGDLAARMADDRFACLIGTAEEQAAAQFAAQIARKIRELAIHHPRSPVARFVTVSFSIASAVPGRSDDCALLRKAEAEIARQDAPPAADREAG
jgi:diguanylate cyclase (GGDEF)-like protein/PAS domain S-box-containing protein